MAKILPFPVKPGAPTPRPSRGLSFTLRVDAKEIAEALMTRIRGEGLKDSDTEKEWMGHRERC
jgi:hypothetical protein